MDLRKMIEGYRTFLCMTICLTAVSINAQTLNVRNVKFVNINDRIHITYQLDGEKNTGYFIRVKLSHDNGRTFRIIPKSTLGDVGRHIKPGEKREIVWNYKQDFPYGLSGDQYVFSVEAEKIKSIPVWPFVVGGAFAGGAILYLTRKTDKLDTNGYIKITIPADVEF